MAGQKGGGTTPLIEAAGASFYTGVLQALEQGYEIAGRCADRGWQAIHYVCNSPSANSEPIAELLLSHGADPESRTRYGWTPIFYAAWNGSLEVVNLLFECDVEVNLQDRQGLTPLHLAVKARRREIIIALSSSGANTHLRDANGDTPWELALESGDEAVEDAITMSLSSFLG